MKLAGLVLLAFSSTAVSAKPTFDEYLSTLRTESELLGFSEQTVNDAFSSINYRKKTIVHDKAQPERQKITLDAYIPRAVPEWKIAKARKLFLENKALLERIGKDFGVQPRFIVALWGVETNFGNYTGNFSTLSALATLAYDGRRETFFKKEFFAALKIIDEGHITAADMKGSWAGAMGQVQFMPSSFNAYAVDYNKDGKKDIWNNTADALASAANYLKQAKWDDTYTWGRQVLLPDNYDAQVSGLKLTKKLNEWQSLGIRTYEGNNLPKVDLDASLIMPDGEGGRVYLVYNNYRSIMRWNRSDYFATSVAHLSDAIKFKD
ncbi:lytic murein transglycosylase [Moritella viscosa]|uniref:Membrane-bound lytic murein transglycosylase n=1 Tax=Moritella viscosa TaxID=80854 RepID=A0ABY1HJN4_9GAMM|nr:lytic murein transglycosylase [Moritella viscosa]SGY98690.1 Membrane-bound lytic murein transglycosylase [Moritella viscosa]SGZ05616.1 Membrane-bound lytic murein transglycosylase [Moritella viscosa]SGZ12937.1 Membrane-bound lytic murein transglycosylase [Moritella viscosa]SHO27776.1 Membrane-bound lytic murein transglycosylase [Moritella viscosa]